MKRTNARVLTIGIVGLLAGALIVPGIVNANARRSTGGSDQDRAASERTLTAVLSGAEEVSAATGALGVGDTDGTGVATITLDRVGETICVDSVTAGIDAVTMTHIHQGAAGVSGPVVLDFAPGGLGALSKCVLSSAALIDQIAANPAGFYFNVHTTAYKAGAIRGNFVAHAAGAGAAHLLAEPLRAYDSRTLATPSPFGPAETRTVSLLFGQDGTGVTKVAVPPGATGAIVTLTVTETVGGGYLKMYSALLSTAPATSVINWKADGQDIATTTTVAVDATSSVKITSGPQSTHVVVDVVGYYF